MVISLDIGTSLTKCLALDEEQGYLDRLIIPTDPNLNLQNSFSQILTLLETKSGRKIFRGNRCIYPIFACTSIKGGLRVASVSSLYNTAGRIAELAVSYSGGNLVCQISTDQDLLFSEKVLKLVKAQPDLIIISGGCEEGSNKSVVDIVKVVATAIPLINPTGSLPVIYAGNSFIQTEVSSLLESISKFKISSNIIPEEGQQDIYPAISEIRDSFTDIYLGNREKWKMLYQNLSEPIVPTSFCFLKSVETLNISANALFIDVGSYSTDLIIAEQKQPQNYYLHRFNKLEGVGSSLNSKFSFQELDEILTWTTYPLNRSILMDIIDKRRGIASSSPVNDQELDFLHCIARDLIGNLYKKFVDKKQKFFLREIYLLSILFKFSPISKDLFTVLNAIQPSGIVDIYLTDCFWANYGLLNFYNLQTNTHFNKKLLATVISPLFSDKSRGSKVADVVIQTPGRTYQDNIRAGEFRMSPVQASQGEIIVLPVRGVDGGEGNGKPVYSSLKPSESGLIFDGRIKPITPEFYQEHWEEYLNLWQKVLTA
ncbi:MAG: hypothetical protein APR63_03025 [Desulfuromonas sp. SDB]|nr:MAG: hypothetical protein APR63_03025 [Desulfuromonas sp. SDB]